MGSSAGEHGIGLSGGEVARLVLTRTLVTGPGLLALGEVITNLDASIELELHRALTRTAAGRTTLTVAHRRSTVERVDRVIVLKDGRIIADITPDGLMTSDTRWNALPGQVQQACPGEDEILGDDGPGRSR